MGSPVSHDGAPQAGGEPPAGDLPPGPADPAPAAPPAPAPAPGTGTPAPIRAGRASVPVPPPVGGTPPPARLTPVDRLPSAASGRATVTPAAVPQSPEPPPVPASGTAPRLTPIDKLPPTLARARVAPVTGTPAGTGQPPPVPPPVPPRPAAPGPPPAAPRPPAAAGSARVHPGAGPQVPPRPAGPAGPASTAVWPGPAAGSPQLAAWTPAGGTGTAPVPPPPAPAGRIRGTAAAAPGSAAPAPPGVPSSTLDLPAQPAPARRRHRVWLAVVAALVVIVLGGAAALLLVRPAVLTDLLARGGASPTAGTEPVPSPVLAVAGGQATALTPAAVAAALAGPVADPRLGDRLTVTVLDVATGTELFSRAATDPATPASTMKLATAAAVLATRGPAFRIQTRVVAGANPGEVVLIGGGDPTLAGGDTPAYPGAARLADLATQVRQALGPTAPTRVLVDPSVFTGALTGPGWEDSDLSEGQIARITGLMTDGGRINPRQTGSPAPRYNRPDLAAGQLFAKALGVPADAVDTGRPPAATGTPSPGTSGAPPAPGTQLGVVSSPPLVRLVELMLSASDNTVAECLARQVALAGHAEPSFAGAVTAVRAALSGLGVDLTGATLVDGSGLSNLNRLTTHLLAGVLLAAAGPAHPQLHGLFSGLPVAGYSGTLADRFRSPDTASTAGVGEVRAKTGTLTGVSALAGYVVDAGGRLLAFALIADRVTGSTQDAEAALDTVATALAALT